MQEGKKQRQPASRIESAVDKPCQADQDRCHPANDTFYRAAFSIVVSPLIGLIAGYLAYRLLARQDPTSVVGLAAAVTTCSLSRQLRKRVVPLSALAVLALGVFAVAVLPDASSSNSLIIIASCYVFCFGISSGPARISLLHKVYLLVVLLLAVRGLPQFSKMFHDLYVALLNDKNLIGILIFQTAAVLLRFVLAKTSPSVAKHLGHPVLYLTMVILVSAVLLLWSLPEVCRFVAIGLIGYGLGHFAFLGAHQLRLCLSTSQGKGTRNTTFSGARKKHRLACIALATLTIIIIPVAYYHTFSKYVDYDDEGHILQMIFAVQDGVDLYKDGTFRYGPLMFAWEGAWLTAGLPATHAGLRYLVIFERVGAAFMMGLAVFRLTNRTALGALAIVLTFRLLNILTNEPGHVQGAICLTIAGALLGMTFKRAWLVALIGGVSASVLVLSKINSGVFIVLALGFGLTTIMHNNRPSQILRCLTMTLCLALPLVLMRPHLFQVVPLAVSFIGAMILLWFVARTVGDPQATVQHVLGFATAGFMGGSVLTLVIAVMTMRINPWNSLHTVFVPYRFSSDWFSTPHMRLDHPIIISLLSVLTSATVFYIYRKPTNEGRSRQRFIAIVRLVVLASVPIVYLCSRDMILLDLSWMSTSQHFMVILMLAPFLWLLCAPLLKESPATSDSEPPATPAARVFLAAFTLLNTLYIYPIAGSQQAVSIMLFIPSLTLLLRDAEFSQVQEGSSVDKTRAVTVLAVLFAMGCLGSQMYQHFHRYRVAVPLALPGVEPLRIDESSASLYQWMTYNVREWSDISAGIPGKPSVGIWAQKNPVKPALGDRYWLKFDDEEQRLFIHEWKTADRLLAFTDWKRAERWPGSASSTVVGKFYKNELEPIAEYRNYQLLKRPGEPTPRLTWQAVPIDGADTTKVASVGWQYLELRLPALTGRCLARLQIVLPGQPASLDSVANPDHLRVLVDAPAGSEPRQLPMRLDNPTILIIKFDITKHTLAPGRDVVRLFDEKGVQFGSVPIRLEKSQSDPRDDSK